MQWNELKSHLRHIAAKDQERIQAAFVMGEKAHAGQKRKSGEPYFTHPIAVAILLADMGADADTLIAALLHDSVEDTELTLEQINNEFDGDVATLIDGVTKLEPSDFAESPTLDDNIETMRKMFTLLEKDVRIMVIKLVDRLHNMETSQYLAPERRMTLAQETLEIYVKIADRLCMSDLRNQLESICRGILDPLLHAKVNRLRESNEQKCKKNMLEIEKLLLENYPNIKNKTVLLYEQKTWEKLEHQLRAGENIITGLSAITVVFVCNDVIECYAMLGELHQLWRREVLSFQDYINTPMINGYQGLHTTIILKDGTRVRCKLRTEEMNTYAQKGIATLCFDNKSRGLFDYLLPWMERISPLSEDTADRSEGFWENLKNDILGESIVLHGAGDKHVILPKGATALDGAFYLFGSKALRVREIFVNGEEVPFHSSLPYASSITASFQRAIHANLEWLRSVNTGLATAMIREELAKAPHAKKEQLGRELLSSSLRRMQHVDLHELNEEAFAHLVLQPLGIVSLPSLYEQLAEGKIQPEEVLKTAFPKNKDSKKKKWWILRLDYPRNQSGNVANLLSSIKVAKLRLRGSTDRAKIVANVLMDNEGVDAIRNELKIGTKTVDWQLQPRQESIIVTISLVVLIILWGLDPVVARLLLSNTFSPLDLTVLRFLVFGIAASTFYFVHDSLNAKKLKPITPFNTTLTLSALTLFVTAVLTYVALSQVSASLYILFIVGGLLMTHVFKRISQHLPIISSFIALILLIASIAITGYLLKGSLLGWTAAAGSSLAFVLYSEVSRRYQQEKETIHARYPAYLFWISVMCMVPALVALTFTSLFSLSLQTLLMGVAYLLIFSIIPYAIYFECMRRVSSGILEYSLPLVCISAFMAEAFITQSYTQLIAVPVAFVAFVLIWRSEKTATH